MIEAFATVERKLYSSHVSCLNTLKPLTLSASETLESLKQNEDSGKENTT
jgi:hypothetical protein